MEKISKIGKDFDETLDELLKENNLNKEDVYSIAGSRKKGLFTKEQVEVIIYKKEDIYNLAKDFLKSILTDLGLEVTFETKTRDDRVVISMYSDNNNILIGHDGRTLKALENVVKQMVLNNTGIYIQLTLDAGNYKDKKVARLERLAKKTAKEVLATKIDVTLEDMNSYERRVVHNALTNFKNIDTTSEGEEPNRHIVIRYKG